MNKADSGAAESGRTAGDSLRWLWVLAGVCLSVILISLLMPRPANGPAAGTNAPGMHKPGTVGNSSIAAGRARATPRRWKAEADSGPPKTAEQIVSEKVIQFGRKRRELVRQIERRLNKKAPAAVENFFDAIESGNWDQISSRWKELAKLSGQYEYSTGPLEELNPFWAAVLDAYGVAEQAHLWPAQKLLDYGNAVLGSLRPGMVYVGGTDNGRWIPELLNETGEGEPHVIVTQNALADSRYLDFLNTLYDGQLATLSKEDSDKAFQDYLADAQKRLEHDQQFPDEPKQVRPGEKILNSEGRPQVSGQVAVMLVNERLLTALMQKNPDLPFGLQESFPLKSTYAEAAPLGPIMELRAQDGQGAFTAELAGQTLDYWQTMTQQLVVEPADLGSSDDVRKAYSHDTVAAANLLAAHDYNAVAEEVYRLASQQCPYNPEPVTHLSELLARTGRSDEARQLLDDFVRKYPDQRNVVDSASMGWLKRQ
jgi:hypothetical protein